MCVCMCVCACVHVVSAGARAFDSCVYTACSNSLLSGRFVNIFILLFIRVLADFVSGEQYYVEKR